MPRVISGSGQTGAAVSMRRSSSNIATTNNNSSNSNSKNNSNSNNSASHHHHHYHHHHYHHHNKGRSALRTLGSTAGLLMLVVSVSVVYTALMSARLSSSSSLGPGGLEKMSDTSEGQEFMAPAFLEVPPGRRTSSQEDGTAEMEDVLEKEEDEEEEVVVVEEKKQQQQQQQPPPAKAPAEQPKPVEEWTAIGGGTTSSTTTTTASRTKKPREIGFVHIGKTAGSTVGCLLRQANHVPGCKSTRRRIPNETLLSQQVKEATHISYWDQKQFPEFTQRYNAYLITARHPVHRMISWFIYEHAENRQATKANANGLHPRTKDFFKCFSQVDDLATHGLALPRPPPQVKVADDGTCRVPPHLASQHERNFHPSRDLCCRALAWDVVQGTIPADVHNFFNYRYFTKELLRRKEAARKQAKAASASASGKEEEEEKQEEMELFVLRTEHVWDDWKGINRLLGQEKVVIPRRGRGLRNKSGNDLPITSKEISPLGMRHFCKALCGEINFYARLLRVADNLSPQDVAVSAREVAETCPFHLGGDGKSLAVVECAKAYYSHHQDPNVPGKRKIGFLHVGKTAGSTVGCLIRHATHIPHCKDAKRQIVNESELSKQVKEALHISRFDQQKLHDFVTYRFQSYLVTARHPIQRMISWFLYEHVQNRAVTQAHAVALSNRTRDFFQCFVQLDDLATGGLAQPRPDKSIFVQEDGRLVGGSRHEAHDYGPHDVYCRAMAWDAVQGRIAADSHNRFNYQYFTKDLLKRRDAAAKTKRQDDNVEIFVLRTEHLWDDWTQINRLLGQEHVVIPSQQEKEGQRNKFGQDELPVHSKAVSPEGMQHLCAALCAEINTYIRLLKAAINLSADDFAQASKELVETCPQHAAPSGLAIPIDCTKAGAAAAAA